MTFEELGIDPRCLSLLRGQNILEATPVQAQAIPVALDGRDLTAIAQTGTGKTLAFGLPALTRLAESRKNDRNRMLVLTPTRELAQQVFDVLQPLGKRLNLHSVCLYGGVGMDRQTQNLRRGCQIVVATPGRLLDHMNRGHVPFDDLSVLVLDEADRMLDMGFMPDIRRILKALPTDRQTLMFSATFPPEISRLAAEMQHNPARIEVGAIATPAKGVRQGVYAVSSSGKMDLLSKILNKPEAQSVLVFIRTKHRTDRVARALHKEGFKAQAIHGGRSQNQRQQAIEGFRQGRYSVLVATDVAARGLDVQGVTHVVNFDIPNTTDDYIHRIGRTARANASGNAITFVSPEDSATLHSIERALGNVLPREEWEGAVALPTPHAARPAAQRGAGGRPQQQRARRFNGSRQGGNQGGQRDGNRQGGGRRTASASR